jgi:hypothetical protein
MITKIDINACEKYRGSKIIKKILFSEALFVFPLMDHKVFLHQKPMK